MRYTAFFQKCGKGKDIIHPSAKGVKADSEAGKVQGWGEKRKTACIKRRKQHFR